jgi:hypothetical protein
VYPVIRERAEPAENIHRAERLTIAVEQMFTYAEQQIFMPPIDITALSVYADERAQWFSRATAPSLPFLPLIFRTLVTLGLILTLFCRVGVRH